MKEKQFDPAGINDESPAPGMAAVNTHNPEETSGQQDQDDKLRQVQRDNLRKAQNDKGPDEAHGAELNITEKPVTGASGDVDGTKNVDADVTPRNLEADSDGA